jgi:chromosome partitioning protein
MSNFNVITTANNKGGVGKTLLSKTLGEYSSLRLKQRTLLIDLDPQTNLSRRFVDMQPLNDGSEDYAPPRHPDWTSVDQDWNGRSSSADIWFSGEAVPYPTQIPLLDILPAHAQQLADVELVSKQDVYIKVVRRLREFLFLPEVMASYDVVIIDTRPSKGPLTSAALHTSTHLLIPTEMEAPSVEGLFGMIALRNNINLGRKHEEQLEIIGILPNKLQLSTQVHREHMDLLIEDPYIAPYILPVNVGYRTDYKKSMYPNTGSIFNFPPSNKARQEMEAVCKLIFERVLG